MKELTANFSVVLRADISPGERGLFDQFCGKIVSISGDLLHFLCTEIDPSHHFFMKLETFKPGDDETHPVSIPHHLILLISGSPSGSADWFSFRYHARLRR